MKIRVLAICDRCGLRCLHQDLTREWTGYMVCDDCYEDKHPQLEPKARNLNDPVPVKDPRPDVAVDVVDNTPFTTRFPHTAGGSS